MEAIGQRLALRLFDRNKAHSLFLVYADLRLTGWFSVAGSSTIMEALECTKLNKLGLAATTIVFNTRGIGRSEIEQWTRVQQSTVPSGPVQCVDLKLYIIRDR